MSKKTYRHKVVNVDVNNVLDNFSDSILELYNKDHGTDFTSDDITEYDIASSIGASMDTFLPDYLLHPRTMENCKPALGAIDGLKYLNDTYTVNIVTAMEFKQLVVAEEFFKKYFPFINPTQIIRCSDKSKVPADVLIDDCLDNILYWTWGRVLVDKPWNRQISDCEYFISRARNWEEIVCSVDLMLNDSPRKISNRR